MFKMSRDDDNADADNDADNDNNDDEIIVDAGYII